MIFLDEDHLLKCIIETIVKPGCEKISFCAPVKTQITWTLTLVSYELNQLFRS
jgi:hypothetical protein